MVLYDLPDCVRDSCANEVPEIYYRDPEYNSCLTELSTVTNVTLSHNPNWKQWLPIRNTRHSGDFFCP